jgi:putative endonuclease
MDVPADIAPEQAAPSYFVYILACADGTLYTGIARDVTRRLAEHNGERANGARYTAARRPVRLVYRQEFAGRSEAQREEARIKALTRAEKDALLAAFRAAG